MSALDSSYHLRLTEAFIDQRPLDVIVERFVKQQQPSGGWRLVPAVPPNLAAQRVRIVELTRAQSPQERTDENGSVVRPTHVAITMPDRDFQRYDRFNAYGEKWLVVHVSLLPEWRMSLELVSRGDV